MDELKIRFELVDQIIDITRKLETSDFYSTASNFRTCEAEKLFNKLYAHLLSYQKMVTVRDGDGLPDVSVIATISRIIIELSNIISYFCDRNLDKEQLDFRLLLYNLHYYKEKLRICDKMGFSGEGYEYIVIRSCYESSKTDIKNNKYFSELTEKEKKLLLNASKAFYWRGGKFESSPFSRSYEEGIYKLLSSFTHSYSIGSSTQFCYGNNAFSYKCVVYLAVESILAYSSSAVTSYLNVRRSLYKKITETEKDFLRSFYGDDSIREWVRRYDIKHLSLYGDLF